MQYVAVLQCVAVCVCETTLPAHHLVQYVAVLQCVAVCCGALQCRSECVVHVLLGVLFVSFALGETALATPPPVAVCCGVLRCAAVCCSVLQCVVVCCSAVQSVWCRCCSCRSPVSENTPHTPTCCGVLRVCCGFVAVCCGVLPCVAMWCSDT